MSLFSRRLWRLKNPGPGFPAANDSFSKDPGVVEIGEKALCFFRARRAEITLAFIGAAVLFLPFFVFLPKLIQYDMEADTQGKLLMRSGRTSRSGRCYGLCYLRWPGWCWPGLLTRRLPGRLWGLLREWGGGNSVFLLLFLFSKICKKKD